MRVYAYDRLRSRFARFFSLHWQDVLIRCSESIFQLFRTYINMHKHITIFVLIISLSLPSGYKLPFCRPRSHDLPSRPVAFHGPPATILANLITAHFRQPTVWLSTIAMISTSTWSSLRSFSNGDLSSAKASATKRTCSHFAWPASFFISGWSFSQHRPTKRSAFCFLFIRLFVFLLQSAWFSWRASFSANGSPCRSARSSSCSRWAECSLFTQVNCSVA